MKDLTHLIEKLRNSPTVYQEGVWVDLAVDGLFEEYDKAVAQLKLAEDVIDAVTANTHIDYDRKTERT